MADTIQAIFYIASLIIHFSICDIFPTTLNIDEFLSQKQRV